MKPFGSLEGWFLKMVRFVRDVGKMSDQVHFDTLKVGERWVSATKEISGPDVAQFAELTLDFNPLHLCEDYASESPFGRPIAHGLLGLSLVAGLATNSPRIETIALLGLYDWEFVRPIYYGDRVHVISEVLELESNGRKRGRVLWQRLLVNQDGYTVQQGRFDTLVSRRYETTRRQSAEPESQPLAVSSRRSAESSR